MQAYLIYDFKDISKNTWFINHLIECFKNHDITLTLITSKDYLNIEEALFVINRSRNLDITHYFESLGIKVYNNATVSLLGNNKYEAYEVVSNLGINVLPYSLDILPYPCVAKSFDGHGGSEVALLQNEQDRIDFIHNLQKPIVYQEVCPDCGVDVRVYIINNEIYACVKRESKTGFKSNYTLGGEASLYTLTPSQQAMIEKILTLTHFDLVGIDFLLDHEGNFYFNEIEDVVGTRMLYAISDYDIVYDYVESIIRATK